MISLDWTTFGYDVLSLIITFIIATVFAYITLWIIDLGLPEVDFTIIKKDTRAVAIASLGWLIIYSLVFAGAFIAPFSFDTVIVREIIWTFIMLMVASLLTIFAVRICSSHMPYCGKEGLKIISNDPLATSIFYLGACILIGIISYSALTA
jgi:uncharacterized membrane protein YjfL (UPF0719 family)